MASYIINSSRFAASHCPVTPLLFLRNPSSSQQVHPSASVPSVCDPPSLIRTACLQEHGWRLLPAAWATSEQLCHWRKYALLQPPLTDIVPQEEVAVWWCLPIWDKVLRAQSYAGLVKILTTVMNSGVRQLCHVKRLWLSGVDVPLRLSLKEADFPGQ